ncbi:unnamed protein product [Heligmosomoides polygyrus]|uniref:23S rRNA (Guanosine(2251)-2'-O)-methyltransferase RlmB n=1 Tax=Heligmosomoides polygyrus TaxID=6339 RepID=A0A183G3A6_HELPZ|nr:unnamed protein product [Heligmosomoides polygyrus]
MGNEEQRKVDPREKSLYRVLLGDKATDTWLKHHGRGMKAVRTVTAAARTTQYGDVNEKLEPRDGERYLHRLARKVAIVRPKTSRSSMVSMVRAAIF